MTAVPVRHRHLRIYQQLRSAHLERAHHHTPAAIVYVERNYDFQDSLLDGIHTVRAGTFGAAWMVVRHRPAIIEINEPLMRQRLGRTLSVVVAARVIDLMRRTRTRIVTHAIENKDPFAAGPPRRLRSRLRFQVDRWMSARIAAAVGRISFGTDAAQALYRDRLGGRMRVAQHRLFRELPAPCGCSKSDDRRDRVTFLGAFDERKGIRQLLAAWPDVVSLDPARILEVVGKGPLLDLVADAAANDPSVSLTVDPSREQIHAILRSTRVLVLLSQPRPRWREQVGLPIVEALSHGCLVLTSDETGLAPWLAQNGHAVIAPDSPPAEIAARAVELFHSPTSPDDVLRMLPAVDGRTAADAWLFETD